MTFEVISVAAHGAEGDDRAVRGRPGDDPGLVERGVALSSTAALAAKRVTTTIPIVFALANDPVGVGLVPNLARPGGNVTA